MFWSQDVIKNFEKVKEAVWHLFLYLLCFGVIFYGCFLTTLKIISLFHQNWNLLQSKAKKKFASDFSFDVKVLN